MKLNREQIELLRKSWTPYETEISQEDHEALCDMALASIVSEIEPPTEKRLLTQHAQIGGTIFHPGISWETVIGRAEREYAYQNTPEKEAARLKRVKEFFAVLPPLEKGDFLSKHPSERTGCLGDTAPSAELPQEAVAHYDATVDRLAQERCDDKQKWTA